MDNSYNIIHIKLRHINIDLLKCIRTNYGKEHIRFIRAYGFMDNTSFHAYTYHHSFKSIRSYLQNKRKRNKNGEKMEIH